MAANKSIFVLVILLLSKTLNAQANTHLYINEFLSSNLSTNPDMVDFGDFSDWIELYNDENTDVNIGGFYLTDDFTQPMKWQIPANTVIPSKGYFLIWADGYNDIPGHTYTRNYFPDGVYFTTKWCHTNFKLNADGEGIGLYNSNGVLIDSVSFLQQLTDVSLGRKPDGGNEWFYFGEPTPDRTNLGSALTKADISGEVVFSNEGGFFSRAGTAFIKLIFRQRCYTVYNRRL